MYRQFLVRDEDRAYQRILWRDSDGQIATFELNTVTFGLSSAPYLAIRCLHQLANDEQFDMPEASALLKRDLYVDDLITGAESIREVKVIQHQIATLLKRGGLNIRQWASNEPALLAGLSKDEIHPKILGDAAAMKTLGISWDIRHDTIRYSVEPVITNVVTKRNILSNIAKIFDPLGLLGPITIVVKILMQRLWALKVDWDESLPTSLHTEWITFQDDLRLLDNVEFNRHAKLKNAKRIELHGFCDASERAYGACLYVWTITCSGSIDTNLLCAKSRVAPLSQITLARLELCGAALLAKLYQIVQTALIHRIDETFFWTDSTIVLNWLTKQPSTLKTFAANRVADIQRKTDINSWCHIKSSDNPADLISRGMTSAEFTHNNTWRHGPKWLAGEQSTWPVSRFVICNDIPDLRKITCLVVSNTQNDEILLRYSCIRKLRRIVAYCLRFRPKYRRTEHLSVEELHEANRRIIKLLQATSFALDIQEIKTGTLSDKNKLQPRVHSSTNKEFSA